MFFVITDYLVNGDTIPSIWTDENTFLIYTGGNCIGAAGKKASTSGI